MEQQAQAFLENPHDVFSWNSGLVTHNVEKLVLMVNGVVTDPNPPVPVNHAPNAAADTPTDDATEAIDLTAASNVITDASGADTDPYGDSLIVVGLAAGNQSGQISGHVGEGIQGEFGLLTMQADGTGSYALTSGIIGVPTSQRAFTMTSSLHDLGWPWRFYWYFGRCNDVRE